MKKLFTLIATAIVAITANAQTYSLAGLTGDKFTFAEEDFTYGTTSDGMFDYKKADKAAYSDLAFNDSPVTFQYKNSSAKTKIIQLKTDNIVANGKGVRIKFNNVAVGTVINLTVASKGSTGSVFEIVEGCEANGTIPTFDAKPEESYDYQTVSVKATATTAIISETAGGFAISSIEIVSDEKPVSNTWSIPVTDGFYGPQADNYPTVFEYTYNAILTSNGDGTYTLSNFAGSTNKSFTFTIADNGTLVITDPAADSYNYNTIYTGNGCKDYFAIAGYTPDYGTYHYSWTVGTNGTYYVTSLEESKGEFGFYGTAYNSTDTTGASDIWGYYSVAWDKEKYAASINSVNSSAKSASTYDLQGRKLSAKPAKGMYIQGGKKYIAK